MEPLGERETYSPLRWVLKIMFDLFERTGDYKINYIEFAVCVPVSYTHLDVYKRQQHILYIHLVFATDFLRQYCLLTKYQ